MKTCIQCGEQYAKNPSMARKQFERQRFCSKACGGAYRSARKPLCGVDDCGRSHHVHGLCEMHYQRVLARGTVAAPLRATPEQRFRQLVAVGHPSECWEWQGNRNSLGYGRFDIWQDGEQALWYAHRYAVTLEGADLTRTDVVMHLCDNPPCVNPNHLRVGTQLENMRDAMAKGRLNLSGLALGRAKKSKAVQ